MDRGARRRSMPSRSFSRRPRSALRRGHVEPEEPACAAIWMPLSTDGSLFVARNTRADQNAAAAMFVASSSSAGDAPGPARARGLAGGHATNAPESRAAKVAIRPTARRPLSAHSLPFLVGPRGPPRGARGPARPIDRRLCATPPRRACGPHRQLVDAFFLLVQRSGSATREGPHEGRPGRRLLDAAGFAMLEVGSCAKDHTKEILLKTSWTSPSARRAGGSWATPSRTATTL